MLSGNPSLRHQSRGRDALAEEATLAQQLMSIYNETHDPLEVAAKLNERGVARPSGSGDPWNAQALEDELQRINDSQDEAYTTNGVGA